MPELLGEFDKAVALSGEFDRAVALLGKALVIVASYVAVCGTQLDFSKSCNSMHVATVGA